MERTNPERSAGPDAGASVFAYFFRDWKKSVAQQGETKLSGSSVKGQ